MWGRWWQLVAVLSLKDLRLRYIRWDLRTGCKEADLVENQNRFRGQVRCEGTLTSIPVASTILNNTDNFVGIDATNPNIAVVPRVVPLLHSPLDTAIGIVALLGTPHINFQCTVDA